MKQVRILFPLALIVLVVGIAGASETIPRGGNTGPSAGGFPRGCPKATLKGTIAKVDEDKQQLVLVTGEDKAFEMMVGEKTKFRIPGFKKKELKTDPLAKVPLDSQARIVYCATDGELLEVKVLKPKRK